jgi:hypothetical protein
VPIFQMTEYPATSDELKQILPRAECKMNGKISSLFVRVLPEWHERTNELIVSFEGVERDFEQRNSPGLCTLQAVRMIRADVSDALGGPHLTGDNIHVDGIDLSEAALPDGTAVVIRDGVTRHERVVLLKTFLPYCVDYKLMNRCGPCAYNFLNDSGSYAGGTAKSDRLRGVILAVLKEGRIRVGDVVEILPPEVNRPVLCQKDFATRSTRLMEWSKNEVARIIAQNESVAERRTGASSADSLPSRNQVYVAAGGLFLSLLIIYFGGGW